MNGDRSDTNDRIAAEDILQRRNAPAIYVVDERCRVVLGWQAPDGSAATLANSSALLPYDVERAVVELRAALRAGAAAPLVRLLGSAYVVRVAPLAGELGEYVAVLVERFKARDHKGVRGGTTVADVLGRIIGQNADNVVRVKPIPS